MVSQAVIDTGNRHDTNGFEILDAQIIHIQCSNFSYKQRACRTEDGTRALVQAQHFASIERHHIIFTIFANGVIQQTHFA